MTDPCDTSTDPDVKDIQVYHYTGLERTTTITWAGFTFDNDVCNPGVIPFPTCYTGTVDSDLPSTAWTFDTWAGDWIAPTWAIATEDVQLHGTTYTLSYSSILNTVTTQTQTVKLTIWGKCEALDWVKTTVPTFTQEAAIALGGAATTVTIPAFTVVPAECVQTLVVTIPTALASVCTVSGPNQLAFEGKPGDVEQGEYTITAQAKTAAGFLVPDAILTMKVLLQQPSNKLGLQEIVTTALATSAALFGGGVKSAGSLSMGGAAKVGPGPKAKVAGAGADSFVDTGDVSTGGSSVETSSDASADANDMSADSSEGNNFDEDANTI